MSFRQLLGGVRVRLSLKKTNLPITVEGFGNGSQPHVYIGEIDISADVVSVDIDVDTPVAFTSNYKYVHTGERYETLTLKLRVKCSTAEALPTAALDRQREAGE